MAIDKSHGMRLTFEPKSGSKGEQSVGNQQFLFSFLEYGVWLRTIAAYTHLKQMEVNQENKLEKLAANMAFYQQVGLATEDIFTNFVTWSVWSQDKSRGLPDLMERVILRFGTPKENIGPTYVNEIRAALLTTQKKVSVYPVDYLKSLMTEYKHEIVKQFGIPWKKNPSVKLVPKALLGKWNEFPGQLLLSLEYLVQPENIHLTSTYNKLKHGPQIIVANPLDALIARNLATEDAKNVSSSEIQLLNQDMIRMLFHGSRTQETSEEYLSNDAAAPFLTGEINDAKEFFKHVVFHYASMLFFIGTWIYNSTYPDKKREHWTKHALIRQLLQTHGAVRPTS